MHQQLMYSSDERAREMELEAAETQMGCSCSPFARMISRAVKGRNGREGRSKGDRFDYAMAHPPAATYYVRPNARTITVTTNNHQPVNARAHTIPPEPMRTYAAVPGAAAPPQAGAGSSKPRKKKKKKKSVTFTPEAAGQMPAGAPPPHTGHAPRHAAVAASSTGGNTAGSVYHHGGAAEPYSPAPPVHHAYGYGYGRYAPSPMTRWEVSGTPKRHEYFSGEYRWYYPTPVRESIYSFATDANHRLTNMFSEENPNACTIV